MTFKLVFNDIGKITAALEPKAAQIVAKTARDVESAAKQSMRGAKSGRTYIRGGKAHVASAPGEAPAIDTGNLVNSIQSTAIGPISWIVYTGTEYGAILELFRSRPWLEPALKSRKAPFFKAMEALLDE